MNTINICSRLKEATYLVNAFTGQEPLNPETSIGIGSGVAINGSGDLLTAAHVVTGRIPVRQQDINDPNVIILAKTTSGPFLQYYPVICGPGLQNPYVKQPLTIDLALLRPLSPQNNVPHLCISTVPVKVGLQVLMAGYPDDMELPFSFDQVLDKSKPEVQSLFPQLQVARQLLMIKSGMIGHRNGVFLSDGKLTLGGDVFYVDNQLHSGASGGPVVNRGAEVVGIITQRAITSVSFRETPDLRVPSGSTVAVSPRTIQPLIARETAGR
jgi:hypothetical protein